ncbi:MAG: alkaline phosphatase family protein [Candidatus Acetothermia bacterium]|jgi:predicted AlkP superfamily phosphohydrolase/phosphomutase|nr:alkaline phosphatase family protein [Candidatus Acetothermia bacterium]MDH7505844.1 alkaline phosphatase family protein [Candidatus Acetothermia bacterium]
MRRAVIIGLDGMPYRLIADLAGQGVMPNMRALIAEAEGAFTPMESTIPEVSSVAWSSIITGKNPGEHGIFGFTDLRPGTYELFFPNFNDLGARPFWERPGSGRAAIINIPSTYPARAMNGVLIAGFVALELERAVYPPTLVPELERLGYRLDVDSAKGHRSIELFLEDLERTLESHIAAARWLWEEGAWETFMLAFTTTDRLAHFLWEAYEDEQHQYHSAFLGHLHKIDRAIGELADRLDERDLLVVLSDHGFERLEEEVYVNLILKEEGLLELEEAPSAPDLEAISPKTRAFALDPARIYLNLKGRFPRGSIEPEDREKVLAELIALFSELRRAGRRAVRRVCRKEEIYRGPWLDRAPDLVLLPERGFAFRARLKLELEAPSEERGPFTGKHTQEDAFLLVRCEEADELMPSRPTVADVVGLIDRWQRL